jgi:uncharacterized protein (DUF1778 family)
MNQMTRLSVRFTPAERRLLERAAELAYISLSGFIRSKAVEAAELEITDRRVPVIPADRWEAYETRAKL